MKYYLIQYCLTHYKSVVCNTKRKKLNFILILIISRGETMEECKFLHEVIKFNHKDFD